MAIRTYKVTLDSKNTIAPEPVFLRQGDKTGAVVIDATLMDNGAPVSLSGLTPMFKANTADGQAVIADSTGFNIVNASGGKFTYQVPNALSSVPGKIKVAYFSFSDSSGSQSTFNVVFVVEKAADMTQESAKDWVSSLSDIIEQYNQWANDAHNSWEQFVNDNKEIIESIDPGGKVLSELIDFRHSDMLNKSFPTARKRGDFFDQEFADRGVNVKWFGAVGDGVTDDSNAIQAAIDGGYDQIYFPQGTYLVDAPLVIKTRVMLQGSGPRSILIKKSNTTAIGVSSTVAGSAYTFDKPAIINVIFPDDSYFTNFVINNLNFTGNGTNRVLDAPRLAHSQFSKITATNFDYFNQFTDSWMVAFNSIRTTRVNYSFYAIGGTSYNLTNWHADGPAGGGSNVGFYCKDIRYSTLKSCGADRMTISYLFDGSSVVNLSGCGAETTSQAILVKGTAAVTLNGCDLEFHTAANMVAQTKYPWLFDGDSKTIINGGALSFNNYGSITDLSKFYVPLLQANAEVRLIDPILNLEGLSGADKQFILKDKAVLKADNLIKSLSYAHASKISQACYVTPNNLKTLMTIPDFSYGNTLTAKINYQGSSKYSADSDGVFGVINADVAITNYNDFKVKTNVTNTLNCFKGAVIPTPDIRAEIKNNSLYLYLALTSSSSLPNVINGNLTIEYFVQNNSGIKPDA